jgi:hypothetical protein
MKRKPPDYFEPWNCEQSRSWEAAFRTGPPPVDPVQDEEVIGRWYMARDRADREAPWLIWGSRMWEPAICHSLLGGITVADDRHILVHVLAQVGRPITAREKAPSQQQIAERIVACVNALKGVADPADALERARALLLDLALGRAAADDPRVLSVLTRIAGSVPEGDVPCPIEGV